MLGHLLTSNHLSKALIKLFLEKYLRLRSAYEYLPDELRLIHHTLITLDMISILLLSLGSMSLATLRTSKHVIDILATCVHPKVKLLGLSTTSIASSLVLKRYALSGEACDAFVLLSVILYAIDTSANGGSEESVSTLSTFSTLAMTTLHVVT